MLGQAHNELKRHYSFYLSLWVIQGVLGALISWVIQLVSPLSPFNLTGNTSIFMNPSFYENDPLLLVNQLVNQGFFQQLGITFVLGIISGYFTTLVSLLVYRTVFQKINFPSTRIQDSALFNTSFGDAVILPLKAFFAYFLMSLSFILLFMFVGLVTPIIGSQSGLTNYLFVVLFIILFIILVAAVPIIYLIAFDVERKYSFWTSFTKGIQIGLSHFGRIIGMVFQIVLLTVAYVIVGALIIGFLGAFTENLALVSVLGGIFLLVTLLWWFPWIQIFQSLIMNDIISQEY